MKLQTAAVLSLLSTAPALASPQGSWPEDMRGFSLPKQDWIMILPATRKTDGTVSVWNRAEAWNRQWIVPKATPNGTRTVAVNGDSEDMRIVSPEQIDNMSVAALSKLAGKYGASAIAVVVLEEPGEVAVAAWARGNYATWDSAVDGSAPRLGALKTLDEIYAGADRNMIAGPEAPEGDSEGPVTIVGQRFDERTGRMEYRISGPTDVLGRIAADPAFDVSAKNEDVPPTIDLSVRDGRDVEQVMSEAGVSVR
ncbi:hypothetical protein HFO56_01040 [Rhizobium laguerreae]|uniref:hypothetical protein n=1 Tax=Rhizobium laguerreae TaxID=1076926 RepID=UPI001C901F16|nr:hypothetical protein [Rhizobium laguerreae]MBY3151016.1 hypothetical protein [Rhizobium laguerreae]